jgi:stage II sporulation protein D
VTAKTVKLGPSRGGSFLVHGAYPRVRSRCKRHERESLTARYPGALSIGRAGDGSLTLTVTLPFERYLEGIAEVPPSWPMAALEAQAIAARSYALASTGWSGSQGQPLRTPICASTSCQVYRGIPTPSEPAVHRWVAAVRRTARQVLLYEGRPADTVYFSTSDGRTYGNDQVFGSAPLPYLRPVVERDDGGSPESNWRARLRFTDLARFLRAAGEWPKGHAISSVRRSGLAIVVSGSGASRSIQQGTFIDAVNTWAPCLDPSRYPPRSPAGTLPSTIPSRWFTVSPSNGGVVVTGRGWGHGVGMVQWGAYGKARRGLSASQILAYYYGGLRPRRFPEPGLIHVQVVAGLTSLRIGLPASGARLDGQKVRSRALLITGGDRITVRQLSGEEA